jgi:hypothetical protein
MTTARQHAQADMRRDLYAAIRRNLFRHGQTLSRHHIVEVLADILAGQIEIIRDDARKQRTE